MASAFQSVWRKLSFAAVATEERSSPADRGASLSTGRPLQVEGPYEGPRRTDGSSRKMRHFSGRWLRGCYALIDLFLVCVNAAIAFSLRFAVQSQGSILTQPDGYAVGDPAPHYAAFLMLYAAVTLLFCQSQDLYRTVRTRTATQETLAVLKAVLFATLLLSAFVYFSGIHTVSRLVVGYAGLLNFVTFISWRLLKRKVIVQRAIRGIGTRNVVIVGAGRVGQALADHIEANKLLGYSFKGFLDANHSTHPKLLGKIEDLSRIAKAEFVDEVLISIPSQRDLVKSVAAEARRQRLAVKVVPELYDGLGWSAPITNVGSFPTMELHWEPIPTFGLFLKRAMDVTGASLGLLVLSPSFLFISAWIRLNSEGRAIYRSPRIGKKGRKFTCYKFRTMISNADAVKDQLRHLNERCGPTFKIKNDPRITRIGRFLRKYSLDELPQLWNVLKGDMSLVGPRPHPVDDYEQYELEHFRRLDVKPGITGLWQVMAREDPSFERNMHLDLEYIEEWNLRLDLKLLLRTGLAVCRGTGQ